MIHNVERTPGLHLIRTISNTQIDYVPEVLDILVGSEMVCDRLYISKTFKGSVVLEFGLFDNSLLFKFPLPNFQHVPYR